MHKDGAGLQTAKVVLVPFRTTPIIVVREIIIHSFK